MQIMFAPDWFELWIVTTHTLSGKLVRKELFPKKTFLPVLQQALLLPVAGAGTVCATLANSTAPFEEIFRAPAAPSPVLTNL